MVWERKLKEMNVRKHTCIVIAAVLIAMVGVVAAVPLVQGQTPALRETPATTVRCTNLAGSYISAPKWEVEADSTRGQDVRLEFRGADASAKIAWRKNGDTYYETEGIGIAMRSGFLILVPAEEYVETYVYNAGASELLFSSTRSGSATLPNSMKGLRGTCAGAAK